MNAIPDGWKVVRCAVCREPVNQLLRTDTQTTHYCTRCMSRSPEQQARIDRIRRAAVAERIRRGRAQPPGLRR